MTDPNPPLDIIEKHLRTARNIAVVGASSKPHRPSNEIFRYLLDAGYRVFPVNPNEAEVHGYAAYPTLESIPEPIDLVDVFRRSDQTPPIASNAAAIGARMLWLQRGVRNEQAARIAQDAGLTVVMDRCIAVAHSQLGI
ncbi:MAG: CoA-binding protein [Actinobacteria bacterium]|nr:CoA-binding protein [Actinomycetota bacterium]